MLDTLQTTPDACCGPDWCGCMGCFEEFMCQVRLLYPPIVNLRHNGVYDGLIQSLVKPMWDMARGNCGMCDLSREMNPCTACCMLECWAAEYGLPDDCFSDSVFQPCWMDETQFRVSLRAQVCARHLLEWNQHQTYEFWKCIAEPLGIEFEILTPTPLERADEVGMCDFVLDWPATAQPEPDANCAGMPLIASCELEMPRVRFNITAAPASVYATLCSPLSQPFCWNPYVESFKCLVQKYSPCHYDVTFCEDITKITTPPAIDELCPDAMGNLKGPEFGGEGTTDDPYRVDWSALSESQQSQLIAKLCAV